ncbi:MAG: class I SAM-dependent methyltransferase [Candidatus Limnocylindrales bacterium]
MFKVDADTYDRFIGRYAPALAHVLVKAAGLSPGDRALDVGCGPGALTTELVGLLGVDQVAAVDPSETFVEACRARHPGVSVQLASAESLPFPDTTFDHALAQLVVNFMTDPVAGVSEMRRVARPGGRVTAAVWDYGGEMTLLRTFWEAAAAVDPQGGTQDERNARLSTPGELRSLWTDVGLAGIEVVPAVVRAAYESFDGLWQPLEIGVGPAGAHVAALAPDVRRALRQELRDRLGVSEGPFTLTARAWVVSGSV